MSDRPATSNLYAPPRAEREPGAQDWVAHIKWIYSAVLGALVASAVAIRLIGVRVGTGWALFAMLAMLALGMAWIYWAWRALPAEERRTSPALVVFLLFVPFYNLYWLFALHYRWCRVVDAVLIAAGRDVRAPFRLGMIASAITCTAAFSPHLVPIQWVPVWMSAAFLVWPVYMFFADHARLAMVDVLARRKKKTKRRRVRSDEPTAVDAG